MAPSWYETLAIISAHASKFVPAGSVRIASPMPTNLPNVAFKTPAGKKVLIVLNESGTAQGFNIGYNGKYIFITHPGGSHLYLVNQHI